MPDTTHETSEQTQQIDQQRGQTATVSQPASCHSDHGGLEPDQLCKRCSLIPTTTSPERDLYYGSIDFVRLIKSPCKICRLIGRVMALYRPRSEYYQLTWEPCSDKQEGIIGNLMLVSLYVKHSASTVRIPVGSIVAAASSTLDMVLQQLYPKHIDMSRIITWLRGCDTTRSQEHSTHGQCERVSQDSLRRLRLIDCRTRRVIAAPGRCKFVALSYVWGLPKNPVTIKGSDLPNSLPQTIEDSITVTLMLGYTYIWIDRYCIEQTNSEDKHAQIQQMGIIYSAADVVVVAASGLDLAYGLPGISRARRINADTEVFGSAALINYQVNAIKGIQDSALASRAWTLQEGYLAKRRLYFTDTQIVCICNASVQMESDTGCNLQRQFLGAFDNSISPSGLGHKSSLDKAAGLLEEYTKRKLSYQSDALDGISGALEVLTFQDASLQHSHAVPSLCISGRGSRAYETAQIGLNWVHTRQATRRPEFPSWSPLGWEGPIRFHGHQLMSVEFRDEIKNLTAETRSLQVTAFRLKLSITCDYSPMDCSYTHYVIIPRLGQASSLIVAEPCWDSPQTHLAKDGAVHGMLLGTTGYGGPMILLFVQHESSFERVGCLPFNGRTAAESCRVMVRTNDGAEYQDIGLPPEYLEDMWKELGSREIVVLR